METMRTTGRWLRSATAETQKNDTTTVHVATTGKPKYADLAHEAIINLKERTGSSLAAIKKYIATTYPDFDFQPRFLRAALRRDVANGKYVMVKASYKIAPKIGSGEVLLF
jgi:hypothetical protein